MRRIFAPLALLMICLVCASPAMATGFELFGSYWNTSDVDDTFGGGIALGIPLGETGLGLKFRGTYYQELTDEPFDNLFDDDEPFFEEESLEVAPIEAGLSYNFGRSETVNPWVEAGFTYFLLDTTREGFDVDDETGFHVAVGSAFGNPDGVNFFAEALYRSTEATIVRRERRGDDDIDLRDEVNIDLDGFAVNAGVVWRW